eukprot:gene2249-2965_t
MADNKLVNIAAAPAPAAAAVIVAALVVAGTTAPAVAVTAAAPVVIVGVKRMTSAGSSPERDAPATGDDAPVDQPPVAETEVEASAAIEGGVPVEEAAPDAAEVPAPSEDAPQE